MSAPQSRQTSQSDDAQDTGGARKGFRRLPVGVWLVLAIAVIVGVGFLLFGLASAAGTGSTSPTTSVVVLAVAPLLP